MEFWEDLSGVVKAVVVGGLLLTIAIAGYNACAKPSAKDVRANEARRSVQPVQ